MYLIPLPYRHKDITLVFPVSRELLSSMAQIKQQMIIGPDKNVYVEPVIWTVEYVQRNEVQVSAADFQLNALVLIGLPPHPKDGNIDLRTEINS